MIALQGDKELLRGEVAHWRDEAARHRERVRRLDVRLAAQEEQARELLAAVDLLERAAG